MTTIIKKPPAVSAKCILCDAESDHIIVNMGEETLYYCNKHYAMVYIKTREKNLRKMIAKKK